MKKLLSVLVVAAMFFSMMSVCAVNASAASIFDKAKKISALDTVSFGDKRGDLYYKIVLPDSGKIVFHYSYQNNSHGLSSLELSLLDSNGSAIINMSSLRRMAEEKYKINKKGTYYIRFKAHDAGVTDFYYSFEPDHTPTISLAVNVKVGDKLDFSAFTTNYKGKCTWKTTDKKVATVKAGKVTALKAGKAKIRAYMDNGEYAEIVLVVKKK